MYTPCTIELTQCCQFGCFPVKYTLETAVLQLAGILYNGYYGYYSLEFFNKLAFSTRIITTANLATFPSNKG